jgi:lipid-A-disaccharide synthase
MDGIGAEIAFEGLGGPRMAEAGMELRYDLAGDAIMGFAEVLKSLGKIRSLFKETVDRLKAWRPHCLVLIDYPGFNIRLAKAAHGLGIPVVYYISPQVWAWKKGRVHTLARLCKKMLVVFPFEKEIYDAAGLDCSYVGHPLMDHLAHEPIEGSYREGMVIGLMPGSREQEIARILPTMIDVAKGIRDRHPDARFVTPCVDAARHDQIQAIAGDFPLEVTVGRSYDLLDGARFCLVASGTATVETTLFGVPFVILYKVNAVTYTLARLLVRVDHIGMVNLLAKRRIVPEFVQHEAQPETILPVALDLIDDSPARDAMIHDLAAVRDLLGGDGASQRAAAEILEVAQGGAHG